MTLNINNFKSQLVDGGARANLFRIILNFPTYADGNVEKASFLCRAAQIPGATVGIVEVPFRGRMLKLPGDRTFEDWTVSIYNDNEFDIHSAMVRWQDGMNGFTTNTGFTNPETMFADLRVQQLDREENVVKEFVIEDAFPTTLGAIELNYDQQTAIEQFDVTFAYLQWSSVDTTGQV